MSLNVINCMVCTKHYWMIFYTATEPRLIFTNRYYIRELSIDGSEYTLLQQGFRKAVAVDFDVIQQQLYIVDYDVTKPLARAVF